jgi:hypothetical protein
MDEPRHDEVRYEDDTVPAALLKRVVVGVVVLTIALSIVAYLLLRLRESQLRPSGFYPEERLGPPHNVAALRQDLFDLVRPEPAHKESERHRLERFGWVDRQRGLVHIPIDRAIDSLLQKEQP